MLTSPAYWAASSSASSSPSSGPGAIPELGGQLVAAQQRLGRAVAAPVERRREHLAGEVEMRLDRLLGGEGAAAAGGEPVGDGEQGDVGGDRLGRPQVLVDAPRRQRRLVDEEAEPQVVQGQRLQVSRESLAGAQPPAEPADDLGPLAVVADEGDVAVALPARRRLADVVQEGAEAQRRAAAHLVGERLGEQLPRLRGALAGEPVEVGLDLERPLQHRQGVAVDVEVVVGPLLDPAQRLQLGQDDGGEAELVEQRQARAAARGRRAGAAARPAAAPRLARRRAALPSGQGRGCPGSISSSKLGGEAGSAQQPQRVGAEAVLADDAQQAPLEVGEAAEGIDRLTAGERDRDRADGEVARGQVGLDRLAAQRGRIDLPGAVAGDRAPGRELGRELEGVRRRPRARSPSPPRSGSPATARSRSVTSRPKRGVAHRAAGDPDLVRHRASARRPRPTSGAAARRSARRHSPPRGTRAEIPQVIS